MRFHCIVFLTLCCLCSCAKKTPTPATSSAETPEVSLEEQNAVFSYALQNYLDEAQISGAVTAVASADKTLALEAFGLADIQGQRSMRKDSVFWIASMTKPITAMGVMMLVEEKKLNLDDPIEKYLPVFKGQKLLQAKTLVSPKRPITIRDLLTHTSGLAGASPTAANQPVDTLPLEKMVEFYAQQPLVSEPGTKWAYSNNGMNTLGRLIEVISGQSYADFLQARFFTPLGMSHTSFWPDAEEQARLAKPYRRENDHLVEATNFRFSTPLDNRQRTPLPAGGLFSNARDLIKLYQMILRGGESHGHRYLAASTLQLMTSNQLGDMPKVSFAPGMQMGLGFHLVHEPTGVTESLSPGSYGHGGAYGTQAWLDPVKQRIYLLLIQRVDLPNSDGSEIRRDFQKTALESFGK
jgi:CubicO group peptidase (beta-lactamase class C family)